MLTKLFFTSSIKLPFQRYLVYIICFSLCFTSPGFVHLALSGQSPSAGQNQAEDVSENSNEDSTQNSSQGQDLDIFELDKNRLRDHPLYKEISDLDEEVTRQYREACCEGASGTDNRNRESLDSIIQKYLQVQQAVEDYVNNKTFVEDIPTQFIEEYCLYQEDFPEECFPIIELFLKVEANNDIFLEYLTEYCLNPETTPRECFPMILHFTKNDIEVENAFEEYLRPYCFAQGPAPEECQSAERIRESFINNNKTFIRDQFGESFIQYLEQHCFDQEVDQEFMLRECVPLERLRSRESLFISNNKDIIVDRLKDGFLVYLEYCFSQETLEQDCSLITGIRASLNVINNIIFMGLILSIAYKIVLTQMYLGTTLDEIDLSPFTLSINRAYIDNGQTGNCSQDTNTFGADVSSRLGLSFSKGIATEYEEREEDEEEQCYYNIEIDREIFVGSQFAIEMSKDSDQALVQLVLYPILKHYYESLSNIQTLKGVRSEDVDLPGVDILPQNTTFSIYDFMQDTAQEEAKANLSISYFGEAFKEAFKILTDSNPQWLETRLFTYDVFKDISTETERPIPRYLREAIYREEFSSRFISRLHSTIDGDLGNLYCTSCAPHTLENYKQQGIHKQLMIVFLVSKLENIGNNVLLDNRGNFRPGIHRDIINALNGNYLSVENHLINSQVLPPRHLSLLENLEVLVDQWIEKTLEVIEEQRLSKDPRHQEYVEEIIQEANRISLVNDNRLSAYAIYQVVKLQRDFLVYPEISTDLDQMFLAASSYRDARDRFYIFLQPLLSELIDDISRIENNGIIDPNQVRALLEEASPTTAFQTPANQAFSQQSMNVKKIFIEHLLGIGEDMGFFNASFIPEEQDEPEVVSLARDNIFSQLEHPQRNRWNLCYYISFPYFCDSEIRRVHLDDAQVYLNIYKRRQKDDILNKHRILSDRYSPVAGKPLFEIIQDNCRPEIDEEEVCRSRVSNIMINALERQEQDVQDKFQELMRDITNEDTSEALQKAMFALREDEAGVFTNLRTDLENNYGALFDFHSERLQGHLELTDSEKFIEYNINKPVNDLMLPLLFIMGPQIVMNVSGWLARGARVLGSAAGSAKRKHIMQTFASHASRNWLIGGIFTSTWVYTSWSDWRHYRNDVKPRADFIEDLYYISPQEHALVDQIQLIMSEELQDDAAFDAYFMPVLLVSILFLYGGSAALRGGMNYRAGRQARSLGGHLEKLGIQFPNSPRWFSRKWDGEVSAWDMKALKGKVDILKQNAGNLREAADIQRHWWAVNRFYNSQVRLARRLQGARGQVGASTDLRYRDAMVKYLNDQKGKSGGTRHVENLKKMLEREEALFNRLDNINTPAVQSLLRHLETLP